MKVKEEVQEETMAEAAILANQEFSRPMRTRCREEAAEEEGKGEEEEPPTEEEDSLKQEAGMDVPEGVGCKADTSKEPSEEPLRESLPRETTMRVSPGMSPRMSLKMQVIRSVERGRKQLLHL